MTHQIRRIAVLLLLFPLVAVAVSGQRPARVPDRQQTALDRYVAKPDPAYSWKLVNTTQGEGYRSFVLELTSQQWRTEKDVDRPIWKHWLTIVKPDKPSTNKALLFIGGGRNSDKAPATVPERVMMFALESNTVVAELGQVPNQPLFFNDSKDKGRSEDDLIAYTRVKHFSTKDDEWLVIRNGTNRLLDLEDWKIYSELGGEICTLYGQLAPLARTYLLRIPAK